MKLRTRLTIGMVSISVIAVAVCCILILRTSRASMLQTDTDYTCLEAEQLADRLRSRVHAAAGELPDELPASIIQYLFKAEALIQRNGCGVGLPDFKGDSFNIVGHGC